MNRLLAALVAVMIAGGMGLVAATSDALPAAIATHFGLNGEPNGWMTHARYMTGIYALVVGFPLITALLVGTLPRFAPRITKLPNRDYWLAPPRRADTLRRLSTYALVLAATSVVLILGVHLLVLAKNVTGPGSPPLAVPIVLMAVAIVGMTAAAIVVKRRFRQVG